MILSPASTHDLISLKILELKLPDSSELYVNSAYIDYAYEDKLLREQGIRLIAERKSNTT